MGLLNSFVVLPAPRNCPTAHSTKISPRLPRVRRSRAAISSISSRRLCFTRRLSCTFHSPTGLLLIICKFKNPVHQLEHRHAQTISQLLEPHHGHISDASPLDGKYEAEWKATLFAELQAREFCFLSI